MGIEWLTVNIVVTLIALLIVGIGVFVNQKDLLRPLEKTPLPEVLSVDDKQVVQEEQTEEVHDSFPKLPTPTQIIPTEFPTNSSNEINSFRYPNSRKISSSDNSLILKSTDNTDVITNWYKEKIIEGGANVKSFVTTKTNNNILNKLVGSTADMEIRVGIEKKSGENEASITVTLLQ